MSNYYLSTTQNAVKNFFKRFPLYNWRGDFAGGISAGIIAIPLALAFGTQSGLGPVAGLYGAISLGIFASAFGGTPTQISGPTGPMVVVAAMVIGNSIEKFGGLEAALPNIIFTFFLAGVFQFLFGIIKIGKYIRYIPYTVVSGFMTGIGIIIILLQVFPLMGKESPKDIVSICTHISEAFQNFKPEVAVLGIATISIIYLFPKITRSVPNILVALISVSVVAIWTDLDVPVVGQVPNQLPELKLSLLADFSLLDLKDVYLPALTLALLGSIDSLLTSVIADNVTKIRHDSDKELKGQGIGNMLSALIGGIPGAGTTMSTLVNTNSGARTRLSGLVHGISLIIVLLIAGEFVEKIPVPVLAGILITVGVGIIDYKGLKNLKNWPKAEAIVMLIVLFLTVFVDLIEAVGIGLFCSLFIFMKKMGDMVENQAEILPLSEKLKSLEKHPQLLANAQVCLTDNLRKEILVKKFQGPLFFGVATTLQDLAKQVKNIRVVILKMNEVPYIDQTGLYALEEMVMELKTRKIAVLISGLREQPNDMLRKIDLIPSLVKEKFTFGNFSECITFLTKQKHLEFLNEENEEMEFA